MQKDVKELVLTIVKPLVTQPDEVSLELIEGEEFMEYHLKVAEGDIGRIIGRQGRIIQAIRTVVYFVPVEGKKVRLLVDRIRGSLSGSFIFVTDRILLILK